MSKKRHQVVKELASVELDDALLLEELWKVFALRQSNNFSSHAGDVGFNVDRYRSTLVVVPPSNVFARIAVADSNNVPNLACVARNVDHLAIDSDVLVADQLTSLFNCLGVSKPVDLGLQTHFQEPEEVQSRVAVHVAGPLECSVKLLLKHPIVAADDLLRKELLAIFGLALVSLIGAMLAWRVRSFGRRTFSVSPNVVADLAANV